MGVQQNSYIYVSKEMTEESCFDGCRENNEISTCRSILSKKKHVAFFLGVSWFICVSTCLALSWLVSSFIPKWDCHPFRIWTLLLRCVIFIRIFLLGPQVRLLCAFSVKTGFWALAFTGPYIKRFDIPGRTVQVLVGVFIDGLIGFFFARKHREDEAKWINVGLDALQSLRKWVRSSGE